MSKWNSRFALEELSSLEAYIRKVRAPWPGGARRIVEDLMQNKNIPGGAHDVFRCEPEEVLRHVNHKSEIAKAVAMWRLDIGK